MYLEPLGTPFSNNFSNTFVKSSKSSKVGNFVDLVLIIPSGTSSPNMSFKPLPTPVSYISSSNFLNIPVAGSNISNLDTVGPGNASLNNLFNAPVVPIPSELLNAAASKNCTPSLSFIAASKESLMYVPKPFTYPRSPTILLSACISCLLLGLPAFADLITVSHKLCAPRVVLLLSTTPKPLVVTSPPAAALPTLVPYNIKPDDTNLSYASKAFATSG